jgi:hypothetical protein
MPDDLDEIASNLVEADAVNVGKRLRDLGIPSDVITFAAVDNAEIDAETMVQLVIGTRADLSAEAAIEAAETWKRIRAQSPHSIIGVCFLGYDQDPRELHDFPEVGRHLRRWARAASIPRDVEAASREIGDDMQFPVLMELLGACGHFGEPVRQQVLAEYRSRHGQVTRQ